MHLRRWLFVACVTLSHACDSKPKQPQSGSVQPAAPAPSWEALAADVPTVGAVLPAPADGPHVVIDKLDVDLAPVAKLDRTHETLYLLAKHDLPSEVLLEVIDAAPPSVTRFALVVRGPGGLGNVVLRRKTSTVPLLTIELRDVKVVDQIIALEPAAARDEELAAALRTLAAREKRIEIVMHGRQPVRVLAEVAAVAAPLFEEVRVSPAEPTLPANLFMRLAVTPELAKQIDPKPLLRCIHASYVHDKHAFPALHLRLQFTIAASGAAEDIFTYGENIPEKLVHCLGRVVTHSMKLPPGAYDIPIVVGPR